MKPVSASPCVPAPKTGSSNIDAHRTPSQKARGYAFRTNKAPHVSRQIQPPLNCLPPFQSLIWFIQCLYNFDAINKVESCYKYCINKISVLFILFIFMNISHRNQQRQRRCQCFVILVTCHPRSKVACAWDCTDPTL